MSKPLPFLIVGLPRSRTAWLSAFLTDGDVFCHHELSSYCKSPGEFVERLLSPKYAVNGDSDPGIPIAYPALVTALPPHRIVFIERPEQSAKAALKSMMAKEAGLDLNDSRWFLINDAYQRMRASCPDSMSFRFEDLDREENMEILSEYLTERPFNRERFHLFNRLRVTVIPQKTYKNLWPMMKETT
jgi:hypothetical protein